MFLVGAMNPTYQLIIQGLVFISAAGLYLSLSKKEYLVSDKTLIYPKKHELTVDKTNNTYKVTLKIYKHA